MGALRVGALVLFAIACLSAWQPLCSADVTCTIVNEFGCFVDDVTPRTLPQKADDANSHEACAANCYNLGFTGTAGSENGNECWCSNENGPVGDSAPASDCSKRCTGDLSQMCGGMSRLSQYSFTCDQGQKYYSCSQGLCVEDPQGPWADPNCNGACTSPPSPPPPKPSPPPPSPPGPKPSPPSPPGPKPSPPSPPGPKPPAPPSPPSPHHQKSKSNKLSVGDIMVIVFFVGIIFPYFVLGAVFMRYARNATGREVIPNYTFWATIPGLIADGFSFTFNKIRGRQGSYQQL